ncbi:ATP-binding protein [Nevskia soli]|uniref:ATP-binding protein n=1 Tax=Nevskia soli TaxID=418856 RepID=UPI0009FF0CCB|nr:ATP-binding protein [Nevskia soli]
MSQSMPHFQNSPEAPARAVPAIAAGEARRPVGTNLKWRLSLLITVLIAMMTIAGGDYVVQKARQDIRMEVRSTMSLTGHFLDAQLAVLHDHWRGQGYAIPLFQLRELHDVRHLEVNFYDSRGRLIDSNEEGGERQPEAPGWFVWLVRSYSPPMEPNRRSVTFEGAPVGELVIQPDPTYEIDEIWATSRGLLLLLSLFFVLINGLVWWAVSHAMRPVEYILGALGEIGDGNLGTRLPAFGLPEMSRISVGFNHMAETLERSVAENRSLTRRLMQMQEEERKNLARELHDEIGQCVTAIHADAVAIRNRGGTPVRESAEAIVEAIGRIKDMVRSILQRLRPAALEGLGLGAALRELTGGFRQRNPQLACTLRLSDETVELQGELGITLYRVVQECLTNISRHAGANAVEIVLSRLQAGPGEVDRLELSVRDDGRGFDERSGRGGFGLLGMRERVRALGGICVIDGASGKGTSVTVRLPWPARSGDAA